MRIITTCSPYEGHHGSVSARFCQCLIGLVGPHVQTASPEAPAAQWAVGPPLCPLNAPLQRLSSPRAARCPGPQHLPGLLPAETRSPSGPVLPGPAPRRPQPAVRQRRHEPGEFGPGPVSPGPTRAGLFTWGELAAVG